MYDRELAEEIINQVHQSVMLVIARFEPVKSVNDLPVHRRGWKSWMRSVCS